MKSKRLRGIAVSPGIATGRAKIFTKEEVAYPERTLAPGEVEEEIRCFRAALGMAKKELLALRRSLMKRMGKENNLLDAQLLVLRDAAALNETIRRIRRERRGAGYIFHQVLEKTLAALEKSESGYLRERSADIKDVGRRILSHLQEHPRRLISKSFLRNRILVAHDLALSDLVLFSQGEVLGIATELGGKASHTAIMAHAMGIPAVVGLKSLVSKVEDSDPLILDGDRGFLWIQPMLPVVRKYRDKISVQKKEDIFLSGLKDLPAETLDGHRIALEANIEWPGEVDSALSSGASGIGLFRTEFLWLRSNALPTEEAQFNAYCEVARKMAPRRVVIRTFDLGGDKLVAGATPEPNPFLGYRAIRYFLKQREGLESQIRAVLRASAFGRINLMIPMISSLVELREIEAIISNIKRTFTKDGVHFDPQFQVGVMIETPAAAVIAKALSQEAAFFSIGTNDLVQYTLAVDRSNENVADLFDHFHPAVLILIREVIRTGKASGIPVSMCGEMAADPLAIPLLLGLGLSELSMVPASIPQAKAVIRTLKMAEIKPLADEALSMQTGQEVKVFLQNRLKRSFLQGGISRLLPDRRT